MTSANFAESSAPRDFSDGIGYPSVESPFREVVDSEFRLIFHSRALTNSRNSSFAALADMRDRTLCTHSSAYALKLSKMASQGGTTSSQSKRETSGGTVKQLIKQTREELEETEVKLGKLHKRLTNLEQLSEQLEEETKRSE
ncbi:hypothetical protein [Tolypothrix sp. VBCCA 56010]|uniref:hypothetical protein n=1 Tax=Tolypothrix sp. VBCCA 56010 TaxID=3137731 RepID=UPI003D7D8EF0